MRRLLASGLTLALALLAVTTLARTPDAQTADRVLEACAPEKQTIDARALPAAVVTPERCPVGGREIEDGEVSSAVPPLGESVHAGVLTTTGAEELEVGRREDGTIELEFVGEDSGAAGGTPRGPTALASARTRNTRSASGGCPRLSGTGSTGRPRPPS